MARFSATQINTGNRAAIERLIARVEGVSAAAIHRADTRALATVRRRFEPLAKRHIREIYSIRLKSLAGGFSVRTGDDGAGDYLVLHASTKKLPLIDFGGKWRGPARRRSGAWAPAASAQIIRGRSKTYGSAFIATLRSGRREIFERQFSRDREGTGSGRDPRNKIRALRGPSPYQMVRGIDDRVAEQIAGEMNALRLQEVKRLLRVERRGRS